MERTYSTPWTCGAAPAFTWDCLQGPQLLGDGVQALWPGFILGSLRLWKQEWPGEGPPCCVLWCVCDISELVPKPVDLPLSGSALLGHPLSVYIFVENKIHHLIPFFCKP